MSSEYIYLSHVITRLLILLSSRAICFLAGIIIVNVAVPHPLTNICPFVMSIRARKEITEGFEGNVINNGAGRVIREDRLV